MLTIEVPGVEMYDDEKQEFTVIPTCTLELEHSLVTLSKWEAFWEKPYLVSDNKTNEEILSYVMMMAIDPKTPAEVFDRLTKVEFDKINDYINAKMTATWFADEKQPKNRRETITSEVIYYWMVTLNIPFECENWHLNRLFTLIRVCNAKNAPNKKLSQRELMERNRELNKARREQLQSKG